jgi:hypothetical protein
MATIDIAGWRNVLNNNKRDPGLTAWRMKDLPEIEAAGLKDLAYALSMNDSNASVNDVSGMIDLLEEFLQREAP